MAARVITAISKTDRAPRLFTHTTTLSPKFKRRCSLVEFKYKMQNKSKYRGWTSYCLCTWFNRQMWLAVRVCHVIDHCLHHLICGAHLWTWNNAKWNHEQRTDTRLLQTVNGNHLWPLNSWFTMNSWKRQIFHFTRNQNHSWTKIASPSSSQICFN